MERKLASVQTILEVSPIANSDNLEVATVLGWHVVVKKGEFIAGDKCVYCEVDSVLPDKPEFEFMRARKFRVKTIKLRGQVSQGIAFPLSVLHEQVFPEDGLDVTELMGVKQFEIVVPACLRGKVKGGFPGFLRKTDEMRIQSVPGFLDRHRDKTFYATEKLDGTSMTIYFSGDAKHHDGPFGVCSRNLELVKDDNVAYWKAVAENNLYEKILKVCDILQGPVAIQGELVGPGIQGNKYGLDKLRFFVFNIYDIGSGQYINGAIAHQMCKDVGLDFVPVVLDIFAFPLSVDMCVEFAKGTSALNPKVMREGIVLRCASEDYQDEETGRLSVKAINPDFLLKYEE